MGIKNIEDSKALQKYCEKLGREGMYQEAIKLAKEILEPEKTPQEVMSIVGKLKAVAIGSKCDCYWNEKVEIGYQNYVYLAFNKTEDN